MSRAKKLGVAVIAALVVVLGAYALCWKVLEIFWGDMCGNRFFSEAKSPDGKLSAVVFERDCGATTGFSTQVSIVEAGRTLPKRGGNLFVGDAPGGSLDVQVGWVDTRHLQVTYRDRYARVLRAEPRASGVDVEYVAGK